MLWNSWESDEDWTLYLIKWSTSLLLMLFCLKKEKSLSFLQPWLRSTPHWWHCSGNYTTATSVLIIKYKNRAGASTYTKKKPHTIKQTNVPVICAISLCEHVIVGLWKFSSEVPSGRWRNPGRTRLGEEEEHRSLHICSPSHFCSHNHHVWLLYSYVL